MPALLDDLRIFLTDHTVHGIRDNQPLLRIDMCCAEVVQLRRVVRRTRSTTARTEVINILEAYQVARVISVFPNCFCYHLPQLRLWPLLLGLKKKIVLLVLEFELGEPICQGTIDRYPATSVVFFKKACVEDAYDMELLRKTLIGLRGPWYTAYGYSSMRVRPSCPFLLASCATFIGHCAILHPGPPVSSVSPAIFQVSPVRRGTLFRGLRQSRKRTLYCRGRLTSTRHP
jgi:hypothetical protein